MALAGRTGEKPLPRLTCGDHGGLETTATTDANGIATAVLRAGSDPGNIVAVESGLPTTGGAPPLERSGSGVPALQIAFLAVGAAALAGGFAIVVRRNRIA